MGLIDATTPAERERGCRWASRFRSQAAEEEYGAAVSGSPAFSARDGVTLDGASDYLEYALTGGEFDSGDLSIVAAYLLFSLVAHWIYGLALGGVLERLQTIPQHAV